MARKLLSQSFEVGCSEVWSWKTELLESYTREAEQRIALKEYPDEVLTFTTAFGEEGEGELNGQDAIIKSLSDLAACQSEVEVPMWHLEDIVAVAGTVWFSGTQIAEIHFSATFTPFEVAVGEDVLVRVSGAWRRATVTAYNAALGYVRVDFGAPTGVAISALQRIVPLRTGLAEKQTQITFGRFASVAQTEVSVLLDRTQGRASWGTGHALNTSGSFGWPVIEPRGVQDALALKVDSGTTRIETASGFPYYVTRWVEAGISTSFRHTFRRYSPGLRYWRAFATNLRGSQGQFWFPTRRSDFEVMSMIGVAGIRLRGRQFFDLWTQTNLKALCLDSDADPICVRFAATCELDGDDTIVGFDTDLPWASPVAQCSLALPCRLDGDSFKFTHNKQSSVIEFGAVSIPVQFIPEAGSPVDPDLIAHIDASSSFARFDADANYSRVTVDGEVGGTAEPVNAQGPPIGVINNLRAMAFEPRGFDPTGFGLDAFLWVDADEMVIDLQTVGPNPPSIRFQAQGAMPDIAIVTAGKRGAARWSKATGVFDTYGLSKVTQGKSVEDNFAVYFSEATYATDDFWSVTTHGYTDKLESNDLASVSERSLLRYSGLEFFHGSDSGRMTRATLAGSRSVSGPMTVVLIGRAEATPNSKLFFSGADDLQRSIFTDSSGGVRIGTLAAPSAAVGTIAPGDVYLICAFFNGASSQVHVKKFLGGDWVTGGVNEGAPADFEGVRWGATQHHGSALFIAEGVPDDIATFREGFAHFYGFPNEYNNTQMASPGSVAGAWSVLHSASEDWVLSLALDVGTPKRDASTMLDVLNDAGNGGFRLEWLKLTSELRVTFIGLGPGTFSEVYPIGFIGTIVFEIRFADESAECFLEGASLGAMVPSDPGFTFSGVQQNALIVGTHEGFALGELLLRRGSTLQTEYLVDKWLSYVEDGFLLDEDDEVLLGESGSPLIEE